MSQGPPPTGGSRFTASVMCFLSFVSHPSGDAKSRFESRCVYVSRRSVATNLRERYASSLIPVDSSTIHSFLNGQLPRLL